MPNLVISAVTGRRNSRSPRVSGKLWCASLLRHLWDGRIMIGRNFSHPFFPVGRPDLVEIELSHGLSGMDDQRSDLSSVAWRHILALAAEVKDVKGWVLLADPHAVVLRNLDHLFVSDKEILVTRFAGRFETGFVAVRGSCLGDFVSCLQSSGFEAALNSGRWTWAEFEKGEVLHGADPDCTIDDLVQAAVLCFGGLDEETQRRAAFAFHMMSVYDDETGAFLDILES